MYMHILQNPTLLVNRYTMQSTRSSIIGERSFRQQLQKVYYVACLQQYYSVPAHAGCPSPLTRHPHCLFRIDNVRHSAAGLVVAAKMHT